MLGGRQSADSMVTAAMYARYQAVRQHLERSPAAKRLIRSTVEIKNVLLHDPEHNRHAMDRLFRQRIDPWGFSRDPEQLRFGRAEQMIGAAAKGKLFEQVLEIGCAEGMFTQRLAIHSRSLIAMDISDVALQRAQQRCLGSDIEFRRSDLCEERLGTGFDLIVIVAVLEYIYGRAALRNARANIVRALRPGGLLLLGSTLQNGIEDSWVTRWFIRGAEINRYFMADANLRLVSSAVDQCACPFLHTLLERVN